MTVRLQELIVIIEHHLYSSTAPKRLPLYLKPLCDHPLRPYVIIH